MRNSVEDEENSLSIEHHDRLNSMSQQHLDVFHAVVNVGRCLRDFLHQFVSDRVCAFVKLEKKEGSVRKGWRTSWKSRIQRTVQRFTRIPMKVE
jgi:hypothetical protein